MEKRKAYILDRKCNGKDGGEAESRSLTFLIFWGKLKTSAQSLIHPHVCFSGWGEAILLSVFMLYARIKTKYSFSLPEWFFVF